MRTPWDYVDACMTETRSPSLLQLCRHIDCHRQTMNAWLKGACLPNQKHLNKMAHIAGVDPRIAMVERQCWIAATDRDKVALENWTAILKVLTGELDQLPSDYATEKNMPERRSNGLHKALSGI